MSFEIDVSSERPDVDCNGLQEALIHALKVEQIASAVLSVSVVDNATMHRMNREFLQHDYPTDVISFQLDWRSEAQDAPGSVVSGRSAGALVEGEIIISWEFAQDVCAGGDWTLQNELTLYVVHGMLHICGYDDLSPDEKAIMRTREAVILSGLGLHPTYTDVPDLLPNATGGRQL